MANINNGTVTVQVVGGVGPYQYTLLNAITNQPIPNNAYPIFQNPVNNIVANTFTFGNATDNTGNSGLAPGSYKIKIVDSNLCETVSNTLFVTDITPVEPTATPVPVPTATILPTATEVIPTATPVPDPTATEVIPTATPEPEPTATEVIPTATPVPDPTATDIPTPTATPLTLESLGIIAGVQVEPASIWNQFSGQYFFGNDPSAQTNVDAVTCYFTGLILTDPTKYAMGNTYQIIAGETLQIGTQLYNSGIPHYGGVIKGIIYDPMIGSYNGHFVHGATYTYIEADMNGIVTYITTDTICAPAPTATPVPDPTATAIPAPTATPIPLNEYFVNVGPNLGSVTKPACETPVLSIYTAGDWNTLTAGNIFYEDQNGTIPFNGGSPSKWYTVGYTLTGPVRTVQIQSNGAIVQFSDCNPEPTATPVPTAVPTATAIPEPTATPVPEPTATAIPAPTATPVPEPTATSVPEGSSTFWFHWNGSGGYPGVDSLTQPTSSYYLNDNTPTTDFDLVFVDMLANIATPNNVPVIYSQVFSAIDNIQIPDGTLQFNANTGDAQKYYIAIPKSVSTVDYVTTAKFKDAANNIPFTLSSKLDFSHLGNAYTLYEVYPDPNPSALTLNVV